MIEVSEQKCLAMNCTAIIKEEPPFVELVSGDGCCIVFRETTQLEGAFDGNCFLLVVQLPNSVLEGNVFKVRPVLLKPSSTPDQTTQSVTLPTNTFIGLSGGPRTTEFAIDGGQLGEIKVLESSDDHVKIRVEVPICWNEDDVQTFRKEVFLPRSSFCSRISELPSEEWTQRNFRLGPFNLGTTIDRDSQSLMD